LNNTMEATIRRYKSIKELRLRLRPVTVLVGPPASGKSNLLEALALLGLAGKLVEIKMNYTDLSVFCNTEVDAWHLLRVGDALDVFPMREPEATTVKLSVAGESYRAELVLRQVEEKPRLYARYMRREKGVAVGPLDVDAPGTKPGFCDDLEYYADSLQGWSLVSRLYGFERYGVEAALDRALVCSENIDVHCMEPRYVLAETGSNMAVLAAGQPRVLRIVNKWLEALDMPTRLGAARGPGINAFVAPFIHGFALSPLSVSSGLARMLYYLLALQSNTVAAKLKPDTKRLVLLEEPEARIFPYGFEVLADAIGSAAEKGVNVVLTTHNGFLATKLTEHVRLGNLAVYYVYLDKEGYTQAVELDLGRLAEELITLDDLLALSPREVLEEYAAQTNN